MVLTGQGFNWKLRGNKREGCSGNVKLVPGEGTVEKGFPLRTDGSLGLNQRTRVAPRQRAAVVLGLGARGSVDCHSGPASEL